LKRTTEPKATGRPGTRAHSRWQLESPHFASSQPIVRNVPAASCTKLGSPVPDATIAAGGVERGPVQRPETLCPPNLCKCVHASARRLANSVDSRSRSCSCRHCSSSAMRRLSTACSRTRSCSSTRCRSSSFSCRQCMLIPVRSAHCRMQWIRSVRARGRRGNAAKLKLQRELLGAQAGDDQSAGISSAWAEPRGRRRRISGASRVGGAAWAFLSHLSDDRGGAHSWHGSRVPRRRCIGQWRWRGARMLMGVTA
jgi:hypothetical protein